MSYILAVISTAFLLFGNIGSSGLEAASKSKEKSAKSKFKPIPKSIKRGVYTSKKIKSFWEDGALFIEATYKIHGHLVEIQTVVDVATLSGTIYDIGDQFTFIDGALTSNLTLWEYGTYGGNACMAHYYTDATVYTTNYESVWIVK